jgi:hypothetical protein
MTLVVVAVRSSAILLAALGCVIGLEAGSARAQICANDPTRTIFAGGPGTEACDQFDNDQEDCERAFHRSGAGHLAPCVWDSDCQGNTAHYVPGEANTCEDLPEQGCIDPTRTLRLEGGSDGADSGTLVCNSLTDRETCETAWHTTPKGVGISCCWDEDRDGCEGSVWGFSNGGCLVGNTCFASSGPAPAPTLDSIGMLAIASALLFLGVRRIPVPTRPA